MLVVIGTDSTGKSNYHTIMNTTGHDGLKLIIQGQTTLEQSFILIYKASEEKGFKYAG